MKTDGRLTVLELTMNAITNLTGIEHEYEYRFHPTRKWRFDVAFPQVKIALEIEGGIWQYGRHNRASSFLKDMEKYNEAAAIDWLVLRCPWEWVEDGRIFEVLLRAVKMRSGQRERKTVKYED